MDARTWRGDGVAGWKYPSLLEYFQTDTGLMARKRHLASTARGFYCFCLMSHWRNRGEVNVLTNAVPWSFTEHRSAPPHIDTLLAFCTLLLTIWIFQVLLESLKIHQGRPRSNLSEVENSPKWPWFVKIIEIFFPGRSTIGALVGRPDTLWSVVQAPYGRSTTDLMVGRPSDLWMKWTKNWVVGQWFFAQKGQNVQFWFSRLQVEVAKIQLSFW